MDIHEERDDNLYRITHYDERGVCVNDQWLTQSFIITPSSLLAHWKPQSVDELHPSSWQPILSIQPHLLLIGTGVHSINIDPKQLAPLYEAHIAVECMSTPAACRTFVALSQEGRSVAAALLIDLKE